MSTQRIWPRYACCFVLFLTAYSLSPRNGKCQSPAGQSAGTATAAGATHKAEPAGPTDPRAQKTYQEAIALEKKNSPFALDTFRKADKQDGNHCAACANKILTLATARQDFKAASEAADELIALAKTPEEQVAAHMGRAQMLMAMGKAKKKPECYTESEKELETTLALKPGSLSALYLKGVCLADEQQDDAARQVFVSLQPRLHPGSVDYERVSRYVERPDLVRARMAPPFSVTALDGSHVSLDELHDKVVLIDFWATWCGPCREALPHIQKIAEKFKGEPLVVLSVRQNRSQQHRQLGQTERRQGVHWDC